jgi:hypothetical protein
MHNTVHNLTRVVRTATPAVYFTCSAEHHNERILSISIWLLALAAADTDSEVTSVGETSLVALAQTLRQRQPHSFA